MKNKLLAAVCRWTARILGARLVVPLALLLALTVPGCAHFENQTLENEPHAVIHVVKLRGMSSDYYAVSKIDGVPVRFQKTLRVRPGEHEVVVCLLNTTTDSYTGVTAGAPLSDSRANVNVSSSGQTTVTGVQPFGGMQMANLNVESREASYYTNRISVEAGWTYELDGYNLTQTQPCQ